MAGSAKITEIEVLARFRASLREFEVNVRTVLENLMMQANRGIEWVETDRTLHWPQQVRQRGEQLSEAQNRLAYRRSLKVGDHEPACDEEKKQVYLAKEGLNEAQHKLEMVQHWRRVARGEVHEFNSRLGKLQRWLDNDLPRALVALERMTAALNQYAQRSGAATGSTGITSGSSAAEAEVDLELGAEESIEPEGGAGKEAGGESL